MSFNSLLASSNPHFTIFGIDIYYYAVIIVSGMLLAIGVVCLLFKRRNLPVDWVLDLIICVIPLAIIGARVYFCIFYGVPIKYWFSLDEDHGIRAGGLAIYGGVIMGAVGVVIFCLIKKVNFLRIADCVVPALILGQGIGRWGNFVNQEAYGNLVTNPNLQWFPYAVEVNGAWYQATFFYESMACLIGFVLLFIFAWKVVKRPSGMTLCGYMIIYGIERSIVEGFRADSLYIGSIRVSQLLSILIVVGGVALLLVLMYFNKKKYGAYFGAATGEPDSLAILPKLYTKEQLKKMEDEKKQAEKNSKTNTENADVSKELSKGFENTNENSRAEQAETKFTNDKKDAEK